MTIACVAFDTLDFVKRLEDVGVDTRVAEVHVALQVEFKRQILENQEQVQEQIYTTPV